MSYLDRPCENCGAEAGRECGPECGSDYQVQFSDLQFPEEDHDATRSIEDSLAIIAANVHLLPFGNLVGVRGMGAPDRADFDVQGYLDRLADWMAEYQPILRAMVDELEVQSRQRIGMQIERDVLDGVIRRALEGDTCSA